MESIMLISTGHRKQGMDLLNTYIEETEGRRCKRKGINSKTNLMLERAKKIRDNVNADTEF